MTLERARQLRQVARSSAWAVYWEPEETREFAHEPLTPVEREIGRMLLAGDLTEPEFDALVERVGSERAVDILKRALIPNIGPIHPKESIDVFLEQRGESWSWILERIYLGYAGVKVQVVLLSIVEETADMRGAEGGGLELPR